jgi:hypothetical protein
LFVQAPGSNGKVLFGSRDARSAPGAAAAAAGWLDPSDSRLRRVPFVTQRPTFSELKRVLFTLGAVMAVQVKPTAAAAAGGEGGSEGTAAEGSQQPPSKQATAGSSQTLTQSGVAEAAGAPGGEAPGDTSRSVTPESLVVVPPVASPGSKKQVGHVQASKHVAGWLLWTFFT